MNTNASQYFDAESDSVLASLDATTLTITLNRPKIKNAMNRKAFDLLFDILRAASVDDAVRAVIVTGSGGDFCSGADISDAPIGHPLSRVRHLSRTAEAIYSFPKPVIAMVEGVAVGAGWNLALCCDLVVASTNSRFSAIFAKRALSLDFGGAWLLPRLAGLQQAKRLAFLAEFISADEAYDLGLVTWVKPPEEIHGFTVALAKRIGALPPVALAQNKELLNAGVVSSFRQTLDEEARAQAINYGTEDAPIARQAFKDKVEPDFTGKWAL